MDISDLMGAPDFEVRRSSQESPNPQGLDRFVQYICVLEGIKSKIKNLHWSAEKLPSSDKRGAHLYLDDFLGIVSDFQDTVAESSSGIYGSMPMNCIEGIGFSASSTDDLMNYVKDKTMPFYMTLEGDPRLAGIKSETEVFIKDIQKYIYLFRLTK